MPSHLTRKKRTAPLLAEKSFTIVSTGNKKVHAHSLHKQMEPSTPLAAAADSITLGLQMRAKNTRATGHTRKNKKASPQPSHFMAFLRSCSRRSFMIASKRWATNTLVTYQWKQQKRPCLPTHKQMNLLRHWPAAHPITLGSQMRAKNTRATGHIKQKGLIPAQSLYGRPPSL